LAWQRVTVWPQVTTLLLNEPKTSHGQSVGTEIPFIHDLQVIVTIVFRPTSTSALEFPSTKRPWQEKNCPRIPYSPWFNLAWKHISAESDSLFVTCKVAVGFECCSSRSQSYWRKSQFKRIEILRTWDIKDYLGRSYRYWSVCGSHRHSVKSSCRFCLFVKIQWVYRLKLQPVYEITFFDLRSWWMLRTCVFSIWKEPNLGEATCYYGHRFSLQSLVSMRFLLIQSATCHFNMIREYPSSSFLSEGVYDGVTQTNQIFAQITTGHDTHIKTRPSAA
jgi:ABC-type cobalt transport system substrate-binding protein